MDVRQELERLYLVLRAEMKAIIDNNDHGNPRKRQLQVAMAAIGDAQIRLGGVR